MIIADTDLLVYLLLRGEHNEAAERVLLRDPLWTVPILWRSEFRSILTLYLRRKLLTMTEALEAFGHAETLVLGREFSVDTGQVLEFVAASNCSAYDCEFVALANELAVPLVTSDGRVLRAFPDIAVSPAAFLA